MPKKTEEVEPVKDVSVEIRHANGETERVAPAAADILCRKEEGCVNVAEEKAKKAAADKLAKEAAEKE